jgi:hypothetical protein
MRHAKFKVTFSRHKRTDAVNAFHHTNIEGLGERRDTVKNVVLLFLNWAVRKFFRALAARGIIQRCQAHIICVWD